MKQKIHFALLSLALFSLVFTGFSSAPPAFAHGTIDQISLIPNGGSITIQAGTGQQFTPTVDNLVAVDIDLDLICEDNWTVNIHSGTITGTIVGSAPHIVTPDLVQHVDFTSPTPLTPGFLYVIEIMSASNSCNWKAAAGNPYGGGDLINLGIVFLNADTGFATYHNGGEPADEDGDGVLDGDDLCPGTASGVEVDADGCPIVIPPADEDGDGVLDGDDLCLGTASGVEVDADGCTIVIPPADEKKSCEALDKAAENGNGKKEGIEKAKSNNGCN